MDDYEARRIPKIWRKRAKLARLVAVVAEEDGRFDRPEMLSDTVGLREDVQANEAGDLTIRRGSVVGAELGSSCSGLRGQIERKSTCPRPQLNDSAPIRSLVEDGFPENEVTPVLGHRDAAEADSLERVIPISFHTTGIYHPAPRPPCRVGYSPGAAG